MSSFSSMLAKPAPALELLRYPLYASPKLNGVRNHIIGGNSLSRKLLPWNNGAIQLRFGRKKFDNLDGEFIYGDPTAHEVLRVTNSVVSSGLGSIDLLKMHIFDDFTNPKLPFHERFVRAAARVRGDSRFDIVPHILVNDAAQLEAYEAQCITMGYEGVMIRAPEGPYKYGRSTVREGWLLKVKRFVDSEAVIDDAIELEHNDNEKTLVSNGKGKRNTKKSGMVAGGKLGSLVVRDVHGKFKGIDFGIGSGFDDAERHALWAMHKEGKLVGKIVKYQYFPIGIKLRPQWPTFLSFRDPMDM